MQLLNINSAKAIWLFDLLDLNPRGDAVLSELLEWLKSTYGFLKYPSSPVDFDQNTQTLSFIGGKFLSGKDETGKERYIYVDLIVYKDGLVASTRSSTKDTDRFLEEALQAACAKFNLPYRSDLVTKKLYLSEIDVRLDKPLNLIHPIVQSMESTISSLLGKVGFEFSGFTFSPEPKAPWQYSQFRIERKLNTPWSENRYYSIAPLHTEDHLGLIEEFEHALDDSSSSSTPSATTMFR